MPLPPLSDAQNDGIVQKVAAYIGQQRQTYRPAAVPLSLSQHKAMHPFFPEPALDATRLRVLTGRRVTNPPFYGELIKMGFEAASLPDFERMAAITFVDTVVSHEPCTDKAPVPRTCPRRPVREAGLGSVRQQIRQGLPIIRGGSYEAIPPEMNAYELDARFAAAPTKAFSVTEEVQRWINDGRF